ncbi:membrane-spanning 4-domains subfamily A member 4A-like [Dendropsophus ebraccatus]|uniref:membrane-spanning 4-domains subfamily A member 4A-like n=1 Tax=Dendropsophus ebraccatus TaxID=150705 RepID=UPI003831DFC8
MSPVAPDTGGFVVISQVRPKNDQGDRPEGESSDAPVTLPKPLVSFYQGEPEALGTTQIFAGILLISIGIPLTRLQRYSYISLMTISGIMFWSGILYIIAGSLSVSASVKPTTGKVKASLGMNIFNVIVSTCGIILSAIDFGIFYSPSGNKAFCAHYNGDVQCLGAFYVPPVVRGILAFSLMLFVLMFCIAVSTSVFASRTVCRSSFHEMQVVIYQTTTLNVSDPSRAPPPDSSAALTQT